MTSEKLMRADGPSDAIPAKAPARVERKSDRDLVITRTVEGPAPLVFEAWTQPKLFERWWVPQSCGVSLIAFEADIRTGGTYRLVMGHPSAEQPVTFFGRYVEVTPHARLVWTNDEGGEDGALTTVTFGERDNATDVVVHELFPSKEALDQALASGSTRGWGEQFAQLDDLIVVLGAQA